MFKTSLDFQNITPGGRGLKRVSKNDDFRQKNDVFRGGSAYVLSHNFGLAEF